MRRDAGYAFLKIMWLATFAVVVAAGCGMAPVGGMTPDSPRVNPPAVVSDSDRLHVELGLTNGETRFDMGVFGPVVIWSGLELTPATDDNEVYRKQVSLSCNGQSVTLTSVRTGSVFGPNRELVLGLPTYRKPESDCAVTLGADFAAANGAKLGVETTFTFHIRSLADQFDRMGHKRGKLDAPRTWVIHRNDNSTSVCNGFDVVKIVPPSAIIIVCTAEGAAYTIDEVRGDLGSLSFFRASYGGEFVNFITTDEYTIE